jgi:hypothetical protein
VAAVALGPSTFWARGTVAITELLSVNGGFRTTVGCPRKWFYDFRRNTENFEQYIYTEFPEISRHFYCEVYRNSTKFSRNYVYFCIGNSVHFRIGNSGAYFHRPICMYLMVLPSFPPRVKKNNKKLVDKIILSGKHNPRLLLNVSTVLHHKVLSFTGTFPEKKACADPWTCLACLHYVYTTGPELHLGCS